MIKDKKLERILKEYLKILKQYMKIRKVKRGFQREAQVEIKSKCCRAEIYKLVDRLVTDEDYERAVGHDYFVPRCEVCDKPCKTERQVKSG